MVDFVKGKATHPVGAGLAFPRGFNEKVVTPSGEVWLKTGVLETDKSKFDVDLWRRPALTALIYGYTPVDATTSAPRVFTQIAMGKANGKRAILFITGNGNSIYGSFDDGATVTPVSTDDLWADQMFVFWYKDRFFIQTAGSGVQSMTWDGTTLGAPVAEDWLNTVLAGSHISCMDAIGDKLVLGTDDGKLFISTDGITLSPCEIWNNSTQKTAVDTCAIKDVAISKTVDAIAAVGWSSTMSLAFINQIDNVFSGSDTVLKHVTTGLSIKDDTIINAAGKWICNIWTWVNDPSEKVFIGTLTNTVSGSATGPFSYVDAGEQILCCDRDSSAFYISDSNAFNYAMGVILSTNTLTISPVGTLYKAAVDIEDRLLVSIDSNGNRICRNFGIVAGTLTGVSTVTHVRIK